MKCNKHSPDDYTSSIGVCASCLRERLLTILVAQQHLQLQQPESIHHHHSIKSETKPIPFQFPQSVSPYISRQNTHHHHHHNSNINNTQRFHFTPQVVVGSTKNKGGGGWKLTSMLIGLFGGSKKKSKPDSDDWKQTPKRNYHNHNNNSNLSVFCLSPLVRPGPNRRIVTTMPSFCKNRSRKLADIGRCSYNSNY